MIAQKAETIARVEAAINVLGYHIDIGSALKEMKRHGVLKEESYDALRNLLARSGKSAPGEYLGKRLVADRDFVDRAAVNDEDGDGPPTLQGIGVMGEAEAVNDEASELHKLLICPDLHAPHHCPKAWGLFLRAGRVLKPDTIVLMGDFADFFACSSHDKNPSRKTSLAEELEVVKECLDEVVALGAKRVVYISGNHETRYTRYLQTKAPELWGMQTLPEILGLAERGIEWVPYMRSIKIGAVTFTHDVGEAGIYAIKRARDAAEGNIVLGHLHAMGTHYSGTATGQVKVGACFGWLGKVEEAGDYMHLLKANRSWTQGFGVGMMEPNGTMHLQAIPIIDGRCVVNGVLVK